MLPYLLIFFLISLFYYNGSINTSRKFLAYIMFFLSVFVGISDMLGGYDRYIYGAFFDALADSLKRGDNIANSDIIKTYSKELGYVSLNAIITFVTSNRYIFITIVTLFIYYLFYKAFVSESPNFGFTLILFLGLYFFFTFTYLRQVIAVGLIWVSYRYIIERNWKRYLILIVLAITFHNSAILFAPAYFLCNIKLSRKQIITWSIIVCLIGITGIPSAVFEIYGSTTGMSNRANQYVSETSYGWRIEYFIEAIFFLWYILPLQKRLQESPRSNLHFNLSIIFCYILLLFTKSLNGGRLSWPFMLGLICTLSSIVQLCGIKSVKSISLYILSLLLYIRILSTWGIMLYPYKTYFTDGARNGDYIHAKYEYDWKYDIEKFYR